MGKKFFIETYGCQMNVADSELVVSILSDNNYELTRDHKEADLVLINTCAIRDKAEQRIIGRLGYFKSEKRNNPNLKIGVLGCMAQRMQDQLLNKQKMVDFVMGPDSYKRIIDVISQVNDNNRVADVKLSKKETYENIKPKRYNTNNISGFISISRGCDNMCAFCVVPFTRGRERSRNPQSIIAEAIDLRNDNYKEITLLGQNVDKYFWKETNISFAKLLRMVAEEMPEVRIRFATSYPQDMTDEVLHAIADYPNICKYIHLPVQSGSTAVLDKMKRGYSREWYLNRVEAIHRIIPDCSVSTDLIAGFCAETEEDHQQTLDLMRKVQFDYAYMFKYSVRPNTYAARHFPDTVSEEVKSRRLSEIIELQSKLSYESNVKDLNKTFEVLVEGTSKRSNKRLFGRNSQNKTVVFDGDSSMIGKLVNVKIYDHTQATLLGKPVA